MGKTLERMAANQETSEVELIRKAVSAIYPENCGDFCLQPDMFKIIRRKNFQGFITDLDEKSKLLLVAEPDRIGHYWKFQQYICSKQSADLFLSVKKEQTAFRSFNIKSINGNCCATQLSNNQVLIAITNIMACNTVTNDVLINANSNVVIPNSDLPIFFYPEH